MSVIIAARSGTPQARGDPARGGGEFQQLRRRAERGQLVREERVELDVAALHRRDQGLALRRRRLAQVRVDGPGDLGVPAVARLGGIRGGARRERRGVLEVLPLDPLDLGLHVGVADVDVRVREQVHRAPRHRPQLDLAGVHGLVAHGHRDRQRDRRP